MQPHSPARPAAQFAIGIVVQVFKQVLAVHSGPDVSSDKFCLGRCQVMMPGRSMKLQGRDSRRYRAEHDAGLTKSRSAHGISWCADAARVIHASAAASGQLPQPSLID
jgi:hypothetical protein